MTVYIACEQLNFNWNLKDVEQVEHMWREGFALEDMAVAFNRPSKEVFILLLDRLEKDRIHKRRGGMFGNKRLNIGGMKGDPCSDAGGNRKLGL